MEGRTHQLDLPQGLIRPRKLASKGEWGTLYATVTGRSSLVHNEKLATESSRENPECLHHLPRGNNALDGKNCAFHLVSLQLHMCIKPMFSNWAS